MEQKNANAIQFERTEERKILRCNAIVYIKRSPPIKARTVDISKSGICLMTIENVAPNQMCGIAFEAAVSGAPLKVEVVAKIVYSICVGRDGFRIGAQFENMDPKSELALKRILG